MAALKDLFKLMRPQQWFKSLSILFGASVVLYEQGIRITSLFNVLLSLIAVSLLSSSIYVFNDVADIEKDKLHPVKKKRPIASGNVSIKEGVLLAIVLMLSSFGLLYYLKDWLVIVGVLMLINNILYSFKPFRFKDVPVLDVFSAGLNFSFRVLIGWYIVTNTMIYRIVVLFPFFIAGFLLSCKRLGEYSFLKSKASSVRKVFKYYDKRSLHVSINVYLTLSIMSYYFFANIFNKLLFFIGPWFFIQMYWYKSFLKEDASVVKRPEDVFTKKKVFTISGLLFCTTWLFIVLFT